MLDLLLISLQTIVVNQTLPCFLNYSAGADIFQNCGATEDYIRFALLPWEWISGGFFSMIFVSLMVLFTWIKYHKAIYPLIIGIIYLPTSFFLFPNQIIVFPFLLIGVLIGVFIYSLLTKKTKDWDG